MDIVPDKFYNISFIYEHLSTLQTSTLRLYVDGKKIWSNNALVPLATELVRAVEMQSMWNTNINLADVCFWQRELHPIEVRAIHDQKQTVDKVNVVNYIFDNILT